MEISTTTNHVLTFADDDKSTVTINFNLGGKVVSLTCHADGSLTKVNADTTVVKSHINYLWSYPAEIKFGPSVTGLGTAVFPNGTFSWPCNTTEYAQSFAYKMSDN